MGFSATIAMAFVIEVLFGWPEALFDRVGHPVAWLGAMIERCDARYNRASDPDFVRRLAGLLVVALICAAVWGLTWLIAYAFPAGWIGVVLAGILGWPLVATRSLFDHVRAVAVPLGRGNLLSAREAVSMIVGRDPDRLDRAGVARAALESLAESASDGVVAPIFWGVIFGLPGMAAYKAINTMDSMIGHLSPRHAAFGWAAARIDDAVNLIPARLTGLLIAAVSGHWRDSIACMWRDGGLHRSPNAGWPEAALAGALNIRLSGPRFYDNTLTREPWVNEGAPDPDAGDLSRGLELYLKAMVALFVALVLLALI